MPHLFTKENAREMSAKGKAALALKRSVERQRLNLIDELLRKAAQSTEHPNDKAAKETDEFTKRRLMRIREQLDRLDLMLAESTDSKEIKELSDATTRLAEQERQLSGRPLPGTLRPDKPKSKPTQLPPAPDTPS